MAEQVLNDVDGKSAILSRIVIDEAVEAWEQSEVLDHMGKEAALQHWNLQEKE